MTVLGLSSAAAPDAGLDELVEVSARRGFGALELSEGDGHGITPDSDKRAFAAAVKRAGSAGVRISGYRALRTGHHTALARLSRGLGVPVLLDGPADLSARLMRAKAILAAGGEVSVVLRGTAAIEEAALAASGGFTLAWEADPALGGLGAMAGSLLRHHGSALRHIRLQGGGPEAVMQEGTGVGEMMRRLGVAGYAGTLILAPSTPRYRVAWRKWLERRGGWGCGSGGEELPLARLAGSASGGADR